MGMKKISSLYNSTEPILTVAQCRQILGDSAEGISDEILERQVLLCEVYFDIIFNSLINNKSVVLND
jgi:hypothetical protein